jgi:small-conductance mechanosensitive channel
MEGARGGVRAIQVFSSGGNLMYQDFEHDIAKQQVAIARTKSYTGSAILVVVLYLILWLPGFVANILYYRDARQMERMAGRSLPGSGCLGVMLWLNVISFIIGFIGMIIIVAIFGFGFLLALFASLGGG